MIDKRYVLLLYIVLGSIFFTYLAAKGLGILRPLVIPFYGNCYNLLKDITNIDTKLFYISIFYISYFLIYTALLISFLFKILHAKQLQNIYSTIILLTLFNGAVLLGYMYIKYSLMQQGTFWCNDIIKPTCINEYRSLHHIDINGSSTIPLEKIKTCLNSSK
jgi:hypothetical protein